MKKKNQNAIDFVEQLVAAYNRYPISDATSELYVDKLSRWKLDPKSWDTALDLLINREDERLPGLREIYEVLKNAESQTKPDTSNYGWLSFKSKGIDYAVRVMCVDGVWVNAPASYTDRNGKRIELQHFPEKTPILPTDSTDIIYSPDNPADPEPEELPTPEEIKQYLARINNNLNKLGVRI